MTGYFEQGN